MPGNGAGKGRLRNWKYLLATGACIATVPTLGTLATAYLRPLWGEGGVFHFWRSLANSLAIGSVCFAAFSIGLGIVWLVRKRL